MNRRDVLKGSASAALIAFVPGTGRAAPSGIPWDKLRRATDGALIEPRSPFAACNGSAAACDALFANLKNPYFIGDDPALTQTVGWANAWTSATSTHAVAAKHAGDIAAAVDFAREHRLRLVVKGGGHSYQGTSNAPDSLLVWTRRMNEIEMGAQSVTLGAGTMWGEAYEAVTTQGGRYVQGGGCTTVGVAGLIQSGGFGSFSKHFGTAASSLLEAEVVTADGKIRTVNASRDPDLFWALKGGGGGTFGIVSRLTLALHDLPEFAGGTNARIKATSDAAYRDLIEQFMALYHDTLFNEHWGESVVMRPDNVLEINMVAIGLTTPEMQAAWKPFVDWLRSSPSRFEILDGPHIGAMPTRRWWDAAWRIERHSTSVHVDPRSSGSRRWWWSGDSDQVGVFMYGYESLWLPATLLDDAQRGQLANALFEASRRYGFELHFNKGLAGAPAPAVASANQTAMNPNVTTAFALAICADGAQGVFPGIRGHEPDMQKAQAAARAIHECVDRLRMISPNGGSYVSESNYFEPSFGTSYWGGNYSRLLAVKRQYDPHNLLYAHNAVRA